MNIFAFLDFINIFVAVFLGVDVHSKDPSNKLNKMFFVNSMLAAYTAMCEYFRLTAGSEYWAYIWHKASFLWPFFPFMFLGLILQIADKKEVQNKKLKFFFLIPAVIIAGLHSLTDILYDKLVYRWYGWDFILADNFLSNIIPIYFLIIGVFSFGKIINYYKSRVAEKEKMKALFALAGLSIPTLSGFITEGLLPQMNIDVPPMNSVLFVIGTGFIYVSILKYNFLNIDPNDTLNKLFETTADYMLVYDHQGNILLASKSFLNKSRNIDNDIIGNNILKIFYSEIDPIGWNPFEITGRELELVFKAKENYPIPVSVVISEVNDKMQKEKLFLFFGRDLTDRKLFEEELFSMQKGLEKKVTERTVDLLKINERLHEEIKMRALAEETINSALAEKETLLKEIHHRVKNNLQIISSLLYLQSQKSADESITQIFQESQNRVYSMALVHEHLYNRNDFSKIEFSDYIKNLFRYINSYYNLNAPQTNIYFEMDEEFIPLDLTVPLGLILNELLTNIFKYAFTENSYAESGRENKIWIRFNKFDGNNFMLSVCDNGMGLPEGFSIDAADSLGMRLVNMLVKQINGRLEINSEGKTEFNIYFSAEDKIKKITS